MMGKVLKWMKDLGGLDAIQKRADEKAEILYGLMG